MITLPYDIGDRVYALNTINKKPISINVVTVIDYSLTNIPHEIIVQDEEGSEWGSITFDRVDKDINELTSKLKL